MRLNTLAVLDISETPLTLVQESLKNQYTPIEEAYFNFFVKDIQEAYNYLKEQEVEIGEIAKDDQVAWFSFKDIDGNQLEVCSF